MKVRNFNVKRILMIGVLLSLFCLIYAQAQIGDYQPQISFASVSSAADWLEFDGTWWVPAMQSLAELSPFTGNIYAQNSFFVDADFTLLGNLVQTQGSLVEVVNNSTFTIGASSNCRISELMIEEGSRLVNNGRITSAGNHTAITLGDAFDMNSAPELVNNGSINMRGEIYIASYGRFISTPSGRVTGSGTISTGDYGAEFVIGNSGGYYGAFGSTQSNVYNASFVFNGPSDQVTGNNLPGPIHSLTASNGGTLSLSGNIVMIADSDPVIGDPTVRVVNGSTLNVGNYTISSESSAPGAVATFVLEEGATIETANANGISSETNGTNIIQAGSIQTNIATYSSGANYVFNGTQHQFSGCFVTTPVANTVNDITNLSGIDLCPGFRPLHYTGEVTGVFNTDPTSHWGYIEAPTVPVIMSYFNAAFSATDGVVNLKWETHSEHNNLGFYIYRATEREFVRAELISPLIEGENSTEGSVYSFTDSELYEDGTYYYWLQASSYSVTLDVYGPASVNVVFNEDPNTPPDVPLVTSLVRNYPNPFNPSTQLEYYLETGADVKFTVFNLKGQMVDQFTLTNRPAGLHRYNWEPRELSSGTYIVKFSSAGKSNTRKVILAK
jgi:hypothetical protein